ncbi:MAG: DUF1127 domain-containing protein [Cocleimonas sp.]
MSAVFKNNVPFNLPQQLTINDLSVKGYNLDGTKGFKSLAERVKYWRAVSKQRKHLARLDARLLNDIGLTEEQVKLEVAKPFWK